MHGEGYFEVAVRDADPIDRNYRHAKTQLSRTKVHKFKSGADLPSRISNRPVFHSSPGSPPIPRALAFQRGGWRLLQQHNGEAGRSRSVIAEVYSICRTSRIQPNLGE